MKRMLLIAALSVATMFNANAYDFSAVTPSGHTLYYNIVNGHAEVVRPGIGSTYDNYVSGDLTIPSTVTHNNTTYSVTALASFSSYGTFEGCSGLTSVTIPASITLIGNYAFLRCNGLTSVTYTGTIAQWCNIAFYSGINTPHSLNINDNLITELVIPEGVTYVKNFSFSGCIGLTSVSFPSSVTSIGQSAFEGCSGLISVSIPSSVTSIGYFVFRNCSSLVSVSIPSSITSIGGYAFSGCENLTSFSYSGSVAQWCNISFASPLNQGTPYSLTINGSMVTELVIPEGVTNIKDYSFNGCNSLVSVSVPSSVTSIGINTFSGCDNLAVFRFKPTVPPTISEYCVLCDSIIDIVVPRNSYEAYASAGSNYTRHHIYRDSVFVTIAVNNTARGYTNDSVLLYQHPDTIEVIATPYYGYHFARWDDNTTDSVRRITNITQDITATAYFDKNRYTVQITSDSLIHGSFHPSWLSWNRRVDEINEQHDYLSEFSVDVYPYPGYHFTHWQDGDTNNPRTFIVTENAQYVAYYAKNTYALTFLSDNENMGIVNTTTVSGEYLDTTMQIYATAIPHYHFARWNDNNTDNPRRFVFDDNRTYTAYFAIDVHTVSVQADNLAHGTVIGTGSREYGQSITVSATPYSGYQFTHWSNGATYNPYTFAVLEDKVLTAIFVADGEPWQDTVVLYDTAYVILHDTTYVNVPVHDTTYIDVHDTTVVTDTVTLTEYEIVHDTTIITDTVTLTEYVPVHDTTIVLDTVTLTEYVLVHDTTYINVPVHDTIYITQTDTVTVTEYIPVHDTTVVTDTVTLTEFVPVHDTTYITTTDTVTLTEYDTITNTVYDTIDNYIYDTLTVTDTLWLTQTDTLWLHDTIIIHDTVYITQEGIDGVDTLNAKVYSSQGQIVVEGADGKAVALFDINGRMLATKQDSGTAIRFDVPTTGTYMIKIGNNAARKVVVIK